MIIDEETRHNDDRIIRGEPDLEPLACEPVLLRCILPLLR